MQRLFVGDIQGCADEFDALLERARSELGRDFEVWQVGDLVNRGPFNLRVLERMRGLVEDGRGRVVLGNHDISLIRVHLGLRESRPLDTIMDVLDSPDADDWVEWMRRLPLVETGEIDREPFAMVHAAAHPDWGLSKLRKRARRIEQRLGSDDIDDARELLAADPFEDSDLDTLLRLTSCRSTPKDSPWSSEPPEDPRDAWHRRWSNRKHEYGIVYGHWALQRLHVAEGLRGLDTGCVHHGRGADGVLTAWLPDRTRNSDPRGAKRGPSAFAVPDDRFWQVPARRRYYTSERAYES